MKNKNVENILKILSEELYQQTIGGVCWCYPLEAIKEYILELEDKSKQDTKNKTVEDLQCGGTYYTLVYNNDIDNLIECCNKASKALKGLWND